MAHVWGTRIYQGKVRCLKGGGGCRVIRNCGPPRPNGKRRREILDGDLTPQSILGQEGHDGHDTILGEIQEEPGLLGPIPQSIRMIMKDKSLPIYPSLGGKEGTIGPRDVSRPHRLHIIGHEALEELGRVRSGKSNDSSSWDTNDLGGGGGSGVTGSRDKICYQGVCHPGKEARKRPTRGPTRKTPDQC